MISLIIILGIVLPEPCRNYEISLYLVHIEPSEAISFLVDIGPSFKSPSFRILNLKVQFIRAPIVQ